MRNTLIVIRLFFRCSLKYFIVPGSLLLALTLVLAHPAQAYTSNTCEINNLVSNFPNINDVTSLAVGASITLPPFTITMACDQTGTINSNWIVSMQAFGSVAGASGIVPTNVPGIGFRIHAKDSRGNTDHYLSVGSTNDWLSMSGVVAKRQTTMTSVIFFEIVKTSNQIPDGLSTVTIAQNLAFNSNNVKSLISKPSAWPPITLKVSQASRCNVSIASQTMTVGLGETTVEALAANQTISKPFNILLQNCGAARQFDIGFYGSAIDESQGILRPTAGSPDNIGVQLLKTPGGSPVQINAPGNSLIATDGSMTQTYFARMIPLPGQGVPGAGQVTAVVNFQLNYH
jgi:type 1 fimbria pilin